MKRYCKDIDITDKSFISLAVHDCLSDKYTRGDTLRMFASYSNLSPNMICRMIKTYGKLTVLPIIEWIIDDMRDELIEQKLVLKPIRYVKRMDNSSRKIRNIGIQDVKQQLYDYIAVYALRPILKRIGEFQVASIKKRGQKYGTRFIRRWLRNKSLRYAGKADVRKCYESISQDKLILFLRKYIANQPILWLVETLIRTFKQGLSIGSYLSQFLCNLYISQVYHYMAESDNLFKTRKHKNGTIEKIHLIKHQIFFMDDILIPGTNKKDVDKAMKLMVQKFEELGLEIKPDKIIYKVKLEDRKKNDGEFIDMMGVKIYRYHVTIRKRVFKKIRRTYMRLWKIIKTHKFIPLYLARKAISYFGNIKNTDSFKVRKKYHVAKIFKICKKVVSNYDKSKIQCKTATC